MKLAAVATDILGVSGRAMLAAVVKGETDARVLASLAKGRLRRKQEQLIAALTGRITAVQRTLLGQQLAHVEYLDHAIEELDALVAGLVAPVQAEADQRRTMTGVEQRTAEVLIAELGVDMGAFPSDRHCAAWAGLGPGNQESAGKRKAGKTRKGDVWFRRHAIEMALAASRTKGTYRTALTIAWSAAAATRRPAWPSPMPSSSSGTTSSRTRCRTGSAGPSTLTRCTQPRSRATTSDG